MGGEVLLLHKSLAALDALVGSLAGVDALVDKQRRMPTETLAAHVTDVRPLPQVSPQVRLQRPLIVEDLSALGTRVCFVRSGIAGVCMSPTGSRSSSPFVLGISHPFSCICTSCAGTSATLLANIRFAPLVLGRAVCHLLFMDLVVLGQL